MSTTFSISSKFSSTHSFLTINRFAFIKPRAMSSDSDVEKPAQTHDHLLKILLWGPSGTGAKTCLLHRFVDDEFGNYSATLGIDFKLRFINLQGKRLKVFVWDTAGQERFHEITKSYLPGAQGIIIGYDITDRSSFDYMSHFHKMVKECAKPDVVLALIGHKADLNASRTVSFEEGSALATRLGIDIFFETSAKTGQNVRKVFTRICEEILLSVPESTNEKAPRKNKSPVVSKYKDLLDLTPYATPPGDWVKSENTLLRATSLGLWDKGLSILPDCIGFLSKLKELSLSGNKLSSLPDSIGSLVSLSQLSLTSNQFSSLPGCISSLINLKELNIRNNPMTELPEFISLFTKLERLFLEWQGSLNIQYAPSQISTLPCWLNHEKPSQEMTSTISGSLHSLHLYHNQVSRGLTVLDTFVDNTNRYHRLNYSHNKISILPSSISVLSQLCGLDFSHNMISNLPVELDHLKSLQSLRLGNNQISYFPEVLIIRNVQLLDLSSNQISEIPKSIQELHRLEEFNIENNQIEKLPLALGCIDSLKVLRCNGNPIQDPPRNIVNRGSTAVINYLQNLNQGTLTWTQGRILLLGEGKVGKSTLVKALMQQYTLFFDSVCDEKRERTDGIARIDLDETSFGGFFQTKLQVKVWDFGGQDEFQVTHPFFLSAGALVIILYSMNQNASENKLGRWIKMLDDFAPGSTVLIVGTHRDKRNELYVDQISKEIDSFKKHNPKMHKFFSTEIQVSSFNGKGISDLKAKIYDALMSLENINIEIPKQYIRLKEYFEDRSKTTKTMKLREVESFARISLKMNESQLHTALNFLHDLGSILWYSAQSNLRGVVFLDPLFMIDIFRSVFSFKGLGKQQGGLILKDELWSKVEQTAKAHISEETFKVVCGIFEFFGLSIPYSEHTMAFPILMGTRNLEKCWMIPPERNCFGEIEFVLESESLLQMSHRAQILATVLQLGHDENHGFLARNILSNQFCVVFFDYNPKDKSFKSGIGFKTLVHLQENKVRVAIRDFHSSVNLGQVAKQLLCLLKGIHDNLFKRIKFNCPECEALGLRGFVSAPSLETEQEAWVLCDYHHNVEIEGLRNGMMFHPKGTTLRPNISLPIDHGPAASTDFPQEKIDYTKFDEKLVSLQTEDQIECHASCGKGTFGEVFKAHFKGREVAVKKIKVKDQEDLEEIINEITVTHKCQCDYVAKMYGVQRTDKEVSIIMELATTSLDKRAEEGLFTKKEIVHFASNIASGLKFIFSQSIFHHDLKAQNILIVGKTAKLCDFGLANQRQRQEIASYLASRDGGGILSGTINWQGPEIYNKTFHLENDDPYLDNAGHRGEASDVYAFGLLVWYLVVREEPFAGNSLADIAVLVRNGGRPAIPHDTHAVLKRIIRTCWSQHYKLRPKISHVLDVLAECKEGNLDAVSLQLLDSALPIQTRLLKEMSPGEVVEIARDKGVSPEGIDKLVNSGAFLGSVVSKFDEKDLMDKPYQLSKNDAVVILGLCERSKESVLEDATPAAYPNSTQSYQISTYEDFAKMELKPALLIGSGGFGDVYRVQFKSEVVAVKAHRIRPANQSDEQMKIQQEAELLSNLHHTNITRLLWHGQHMNGAMIYVMEFADQGSLADILKKSPLNNQHFFSYSQDIIRGLLYLHTRSPPITHRDMKPENVLIVGNVAKLADFGMASSREMVSKSTGFAGTPIWSPPEAFHGRFPGPPGDVYAFGLILWTMLTNLTPYSGLGFEAVMFAKLHNQTPSIPSDCLPELADCISKCWQTDPSQRPKASALDTIFDAIPKSTKMVHSFANAANIAEGRNATLLEIRSNEECVFSPSQPSLPKPIADMDTDELIEFLRPLKLFFPSFLDCLQVHQVTGEALLHLNEKKLSRPPFSLKGYQLAETLAALKELTVLHN